MAGHGAEAGQDGSERWRMLLPPETVVVDVRRRRAALRTLRALPPGTPVALVGSRPRRVARRAGLRLRAEYVVLPSLATPIAIGQLTGASLRWTARMGRGVWAARGAETVGGGGGHAGTWAALRVLRLAPWLLRLAPTGDRLLVGTTR
jgi:hypothetical protein